MDADHAALLAALALVAAALKLLSRSYGFSDELEDELDDDDEHAD